MTIRTILAAASGGGASDGAIEAACRLARRFEAHVEGLHIRADAAQLVMAAGDGFGMPIAGQFIDKFNADVTAAARKTKAMFEAAVQRHGIALAATPPKSGASAAWREETGYAPAVLARRARFFDLAVLGRSDRVVDEPHSDAIEQTLLVSGRPVFLAPAKPLKALGDNVALGWNGSPEAVRALAASLPVLAAARAVTIISIGDAKTSDATEAVAYLGWHGVTARHRQVPAVPGVGPGQQLLSAAREADADLLVMGGYGRGPWREMFFGGATRELVAASLLPLLLVH
ncbi:MAG TPA: universal stress protein [Stellaceae bacterium]|nr:universal stress protein [Stellaceae bacterium]